MTKKKSVSLSENIKEKSFRLQRKIHDSVKKLNTSDQVYGWKPITDPKLIKRLGKTAEEASELAEAASRLAKICTRILVQGINEKDPKTGIDNLQTLEDEIADVRCQSRRCIKLLKLNEQGIEKRSKKKERKMKQWEK